MNDPTNNATRARSIVLFLHGFLGSGDDFQPIASLLSDRFHTITIDLPGHGQNGIEDDRAYTMAATATAIIDQLDELKIDQANLFGYSMGGRLALYLALNYSDRFPKVILESASPGLKTEAERSARRSHDNALADRVEADFPKFLREWYEQPLFRSFLEHSNFETTMQQRSQNDPRGLAKSLRFLGTGMQPSLWESLSSLTMPILLLVGDRDRKFVAINQEMAALCPRVTLAIGPNAGHNVHLENPQFVSEQIRSFL